MNKNEFLKLWAKRSGLTFKDARIVWIELEKLISECVENREELHLKNFGHLYFSKHTLPAANRYDIVKKTTVPSPEIEVETVAFRLSRNLKDLMISDVTKRRLFQTRQAELRRAGRLTEEEYEDEIGENDDEYAYQDEYAEDELG